MIVSYRCRDHLRHCLAALKTHAPDGTRIWVVDNDSRDGTVEMVRGEFPAIDVVANDENVGFASATNIGIAAGSAPYVLALNPDTEVHARTLERLLGVMDAHPEIGIAGPRLLRPDGSFDHASRRSFPTLLGALGHFSGIGRRRECGRLAQYRAPHVARGQVDAVNGAFMLIRRTALEEVGLFDEGYWMYMEDLDLCFRFKQAGWVTWYEPTAVAMHVKGGSAGKRSPKLVLAFHRGMWRFYRTHIRSQRSTPVNAAVALGVFLRLGVSLVRVGASRLGLSRRTLA